MDSKFLGNKKKILDISDLIFFFALVQEEGIVVTVEDTETCSPPEIIHPTKDSGEDGTENIVSPENGSESSFSSIPSPYSSPPVSPDKSLQVPPQIICEAVLGAMPLRWKNPMKENKELERNFNNAVFSFNTDQFTLQKRLENQVGFFSDCKVFVFLTSNLSLTYVRDLCQIFLLKLSKLINCTSPEKNHREHQEKTIGF